MKVCKYVLYNIENGEVKMTTNTPLDDVMSNYPFEVLELEEEFYTDNDIKVINGELVELSNVIVEQTKNKIKQCQLLADIEVTYDGVIYQGDETSQSRLSRAISSMADDVMIIKWKAKDNSISELNRVDLKQILFLAIQEQTRIIVGGVNDNNFN